MVEKKIAKAWLLLSIVQEGKREIERYMVELDKMMQYLQFNAPGKYTIYAAVYYPSSPNSRHNDSFIKSLLTLDSQNKFEQRIFIKISSDLLREKSISEFCPHWAVDERSGYESFANYFCKGELSITVGAELFAKRPHPLLEKWARLYWPSPLVDECDFRGRLIFACTVQPTVIVPLHAGFLIAGMIVKVGIIVSQAIGFVLLACLSLFWFSVKLGVACIGLLCCMRTKAGNRGTGINWKAITDSIEWPSDVWDGEISPSGETVKQGGSWLIYRSDGSERKGSWAFLVLTPILWVALYPALSLISYPPWPRPIYWNPLWVYGPAHRGLFENAVAMGIELYFLFVGMYVTLGVCKLLLKLRDHLLRRNRSEKPSPISSEETCPIPVDLLGKEREAVARQAEEKERAAILATIGILSLKQPPEQTGLECVPREKRTVSLRFAALKAVLCRPYSRSR